MRQSGPDSSRLHLRYLGVGAAPWAVRLLALLCIAPVLVVIAAAFFPDHGTLEHMANTTLSRYVTNALMIAFGVSFLSAMLGIGTAWLVHLYDFPLQRWLKWALILPLAVPAYISAMVYGHVLDVAGPVQEALRDISGWQFGDYWFPNIRSLGGVILVLSFTLYPYVYVLARIAFAGQCASLFENALLLGMGHRQWFRHIALPVARPALMIGVALVLMEALADYGTVALFGVESFTTAIYRAWYSMGDIAAAAKLACFLLAFIMGAIWLERYSRRHLAYQMQGAQLQAIRRLRPRAAMRWLMTMICAVPVMIGFVIPCAVLLEWSLNDLSNWADAMHWSALRHSLSVAGACATGAVLLSLIFAYALRLRVVRPRWVRLASMGYAVPGSVMAVGIFIPLLWVDKQMADLLEEWTGSRPGLLLTGSMAAVVIACVIRFLAVALGSVESAVEQIPAATDDAARLLGARYAGIMRRLHLPTLKAGLWFSALMVFTDTVKELPATLLLRPFNMDTLAIRTFELAGDGRLVQASVPALFLIAISLVAVIWLAAQPLKVQGAH